MKSDKKSKRKKTQKPVAETPKTAVRLRSGQRKGKVEKAPSLSGSVRRIVVRQPQNTSGEIAQVLIKQGWDAAEVEKRRETIATVRADTLATITMVTEEGWTAPAPR